jgi:DNA-binding NtrC family response regulator
MTQLERVASLHANILLTGETGTGKTRLARQIHNSSPRRHEPFCVINCGSLSVQLIESELFGHVRGAFTGADRHRQGKLAAAGVGTLLLDDVDTLPIAWQVKLLRVVEERVFEPVGSNRSQAVQARFIAASNRELEWEVSAGRFRSDLFHRLNVVSFRMPPLRELPELILPLAASFVRELASRTGSKAKDIAPDALEALHQYQWPGNVRELRNVVERALALCAEELIHLADLPQAVVVSRKQSAAALAAELVHPRVLNGDRRQANRRVGGRLNYNASGYGHPHAAQRVAEPPSPGPHLNDARAHVSASAAEDLEREFIQQALHRNHYNRSRTALDLGVSRGTLYKKLRRHGLLTCTAPRGAQRCGDGVS